MQDGSVGRTLVVLAASLFAAGGVAAAVTGVRPHLTTGGVTLAAASLPNWNISEICASDSAGGQCRILESQAYTTLSGGWNAVPEKFREACLGSVKSPYDKSYRLLSQCLEGEVLKGLDKDVIKTAAARNGGASSAQAAPAGSSGGGYAILPTTSTADLIAARETWGKGGDAKPVAAPLAAGAQSPLPPDDFALPKGFEGEPTVHALQATPAPQLTPVPQDQIAAALKSLLATREGWLKAPTQSADSGYAVLPTTSTADLIAARETWGMSKAKKVAAPLAAGAKSPLPSGDFKVPKGFTGEPTVHALQATPVAQLTPVPQAQIDDAMKKLLAERESWGTEPSKGGGSGGGYAILPTTSTADLIAARETWGMSQAKTVAAPLATGAYSPLPSTNFEVPKGFTGEPTVHALQATPVAQLTPVPQGQIDEAMKKLLAERESWGTEPSKGGGSGGGYAILPTTSTADLIAAREAWGKGAAPKKVAAPLAAGAKSPLPSGDFKVPKGFTGEPTVHALQASPAPQLTPVPQGQIDEAMKKLLAERESWGTEPSKGGGSGGGYAILPTTSTADLIAAREAWGQGAAPKKVAAPLAAGAKSPLPSGDFKVPKGFAGEPTVHALKETPVAQLTPVPQGQIDEAMKKLLAEREIWGTEPSKGGGSGGGYAILPTTSTADLIAAREAWGKGAAPKKVAAPLAAGAKSPLPSGDFKVPKGFTGEPTVHALQASPAPQLTPVPQGQIDEAMKKLLAERESWGTEPSKGAPAAAAPAAQRSAEAADCEAKLRDAASKGVILFASGSANLSAKSNATLDSLAKVAKGCSKGRIRVEGHTDSTGRASFNKSLSEKRAQAVANYLTSAGVAKERVEAVGYGQEKPVASNATADGRAKNRRIEFTVVE